MATFSGSSRARKKERKSFSHKDFSRYSEGLLHVGGAGEVNALRDAGVGCGNFPARGETRLLCGDNTNRLPAVQAGERRRPERVWPEYHRVPAAARPPGDRPKICHNIFTALLPGLCFTARLCVSHRLKVVGSHTLSEQERSTQPAALGPQQLRHSKNLISLSFLNFVPTLEESLCCQAVTGAECLTLS